MSGAALMLLAQSLALPTGLVSAALLARWLSPAGYGVFALASVLVAWVEWCIPSAFTRASTKFIAASSDPLEVGSSVLRLHLAAGVVVGAALWLAAPALASALGEASLAGAIRLYAPDVPLFAAATAHRAILTGTGRFNEVAAATAARWLVRLALMAALVGAGLGVEGAVAAVVLTSLVELALLRRGARPRLFGRAGVPLRGLLAFAAPLFLASVSLRLLDKLDIFALKWLGATTEEAGFYGAAQNLTFASSLIALTFAPVLLATLSHAVRDGEEALARALSRDSMRAVLWLMPFAALAAGASGEIVGLIFGAEFGPAAVPLAPLVVGAVALLMLSVANTTLIAGDRPRWALAVVAPLPAAAVLGHMA
ncbi:MAG TPA: oligosaccharide flippase family protein, partial [Pyrinomonadaceae bacterium]|nr:oligosaccharide flippase family protein [Pyrinomonadaceae bacterium]